MTNFSGLIDRSVIVVATPPFRLPVSKNISELRLGLNGIMVTWCVLGWDTPRVTGENI